MIERRSFLKAAALGAATAGLGSFARGEAKSVEPTSTPPFYRFKVGDFTLTPLCDGMFQLPTDSIGTNAEPSERKAYFEAHYLTGDAFPLQLTPLLIDTGDKLVLIDSGMGPGQESWAPGANKLAGSLKAAGIAGEDIDVIVLTHGHIDHVGGLEAGATKQYANAEVVLSAIELDLWRAPDAAKKVPEWAAGGVPALQQTFTALGERLRTTKEGEDIVPGIATVSSPRTPGHISLLVSSGKDALFVTGDAVASIISPSIIPSGRWSGTTTASWEPKPARTYSIAYRTTACLSPAGTSRSPGLAMWSRRATTTAGCLSTGCSKRPPNVALGWNPMEADCVGDAPPHSHTAPGLCGGRWRRLAFSGPPEGRLTQNLSQRASLRCF